NQVRAIPGMENADTTVQESTPELQFRVDREKALKLGVSFNDVATTINAATNGQLSTYYQEGGFQYPIYVQAPEATRKSIDQILNLPVSASGASAAATPAASSAPAP